MNATMAKLAWIRRPDRCVRTTPALGRTHNYYQSLAAERIASGGHILFCTHGRLR